MINKLIVHNIQSHPDSEINLSKGVNIIWGASNAGKTVLLRGIFSVIRNRPSGDGLLRDDEKNCFSCIEFDNGIAVTRGKDPDNFYEVLGVQADPIELRAFGTDVPQVVRDALNIDEINIHDEDSPYFLVLDTPGQVASYIRTVAKLDEIDAIISFTTSQIREKEDILKKDKIKLEALDVKVKKLEAIDLDQLELLITSIKNTKLQQDKIQSNVTILNTLISDLGKIDLRLNKLKILDLDKVRCINQDISGIIKDIDIIRRDKENITTLINQLEETCKRQIKLPENVQNIKDQLKEVKEAKEKVMIKILSLNSLIEFIEQTNKQIDEKLIICKELEQQKIELQKQLEVCPYCESQLTTETRIKLLENTK